MALIEQALRTKLVGTAGVLAIVAQRVYPTLAPQSGPLPHIVYTRTSGLHEKSLTGSSGLATVRFQLDCNALTDLASVELAEAVRLALDCQQGTWSGVVVQAAFVVNDFDGSFEDATEVRRRIVEVEIWYEEVPANVLI